MYDTIEDRYMSLSRVLERSINDLFENGNNRFIFEQCSGLTDCDGTKIYEGDIVQFINTRCYDLKYPETRTRLWRSEVVFEEGTFAISEEEHGLMDTCLYAFSSEFSKDEAKEMQFKVVGNVHHHSNLLKPRYMNIKLKENQIKGKV